METDRNRTAILLFTQQKQTTVKSWKAYKNDYLAKDKNLICISIEKNVKKTFLSKIKTSCNLAGLTRIFSYSSKSFRSKVYIYFHACMYICRHVCDIYIEVQEMQWENTWFVSFFILELLQIILLCGQYI